MASIPLEIKDGIEAYAKKQWPNDNDMQAYIVEKEKESYSAIANLNFEKAESYRQIIMSNAHEYSESWEERLSFILDEIKAIDEMAICPDDIPVELFTAIKEKAQIESDWYCIQRDKLKNELDSCRYIQHIRTRVDPIREILIHMEEIIAREFYNANIQNYGPGGKWEGEGRGFRYPVTFRTGTGDKKLYKGAESIPSDVLMTGSYRFGANQLNIYGALLKIIEFLKRNHGFDPSKNRG